MIEFEKMSTLGAIFLLSALSVWIVLVLLQQVFKKHLQNITPRNRRKPPMFFRLFFLVFLTALTIYSSSWDYSWASSVQTTARSIALISLGLVINSLLKVFTYWVYKHYDINTQNNLRQRKIVTQVRFLEKLVLILNWVVICSLLLMGFTELSTIGRSLLASAGLASVIIGFAAQKSLSNLVAGFQLAFTQPLRLDDAVVIEGEWGWVEEITLTYVVVKIWDRRRLILPITYLIEKPFQNWTRETAQIIGNIVFHLDFQVNIEALREEFNKTVERQPLWDHDVCVLQVIDTTATSIVVRGLMTAKTSPEAWDLRCAVREELMIYLQEKQPQALPLQRVQLAK